MSYRKINDFFQKAKVKSEGIALVARPVTSICYEWNRISRIFKWPVGGLTRYLDREGRHGVVGVELSRNRDGASLVEDFELRLCQV